MSSQIPTRDAALALLKNYNTRESLIKHAFMGMREVAFEIGLKGDD